jgi:branched-chain amino acid transport system ATP-binding protein
MDALLRCEDVTKKFGGIVALDGFDATVAADSITGLIGPNGAGKTTLFNVVTGVLTPEEGQVRFDGTDVTGRAPHEICHAGIARTFQTPQPIRSLTVEENLRVAGKFGSGDETVATERLEELLSLLSLESRRDDGAGTLQMVEQKYVDLGRALLTMPDLVLLDEMLAGLNPTEKAAMIEAIQRVHAELDVDFLVVEHDLRAIRELSERVIVVNEGRFMAGGAPGDVLDDEAVQEAYIGS